MKVNTTWRHGHAIWLHGTIAAAHRHHPNATTQVCRMAHRAGVPWTLQVTCAPRGIKPLQALRALKYVCVINDVKRKQLWLTSASVDMAELALDNVIKQAATR